MAIAKAEAILLDDALLPASFAMLNEHADFRGA
jgi:hypothetical protein